MNTGTVWNLYITVKAYKSIELDIQLGLLLGETFLILCVRLLRHLILLSQDPLVVRLQLLDLCPDCLDLPLDGILGSVVNLPGMLNLLLVLLVLLAHFLRLNGLDFCLELLGLLHLL